ncbi:MAG: RNA polymerase sigma factor [Bacillota bacterium]
MVHAEADRREAFAALYSQMAPRLYRTALGILGNPHDAADALQEAGLKGYRYFHSLKDPAAGAAWLTRILVNACHDVGAKRSRMIPSGLEVLPAAGAPAATEEWETLQALQGLPPEQRTTVVLRFFQDLSIPQIAGVMGVPEGTVKSRLHASLGRLRRLFAESGKEGAQ